MVRHTYSGSDCGAIMAKSALRYGYLLLLFLLFSFVLNEVLLRGNDLIAEAADRMLTGQQVSFPEAARSLLWMVALGTAAAYLKSIFGKNYSAAMQREVRSSLGRHLLKLPLSAFDEKGTGGIITRLVSDVEEMGRFFSEILPGLLVNLITVLTATIYLVQMDAALIVVLFASYPIMLVAADQLSKRLAELAKKMRTRMDERTEKAYDAIQGMAVGRSCNLYEFHKRRINTVIDNMVEQACKSTKISSLGWVLKNVLTTLPVLFCYLSALYETRQGRITVGDMLVFTVILNRILYPIGDIVFCANDLRESGVSLKRIQEIFDRQEEKKGGQITLADCTREEAEGGAAAPAIRWRDVFFSYQGGKEHSVLNGMSFCVEAGRQTAFVGGSGEGKTTIFKLLCGFYERDGGEYQLFGHSFEEWNLEAARSCFSEVSQNVFLLPGTIRQNVACGKENASEEELVEACKNANIHDFIMGLPEGYETPVGERGVLLSGGQRQRISIARAFLKDAPVLLLDEPTASVDVESEMKIQEAIEKVAAGRTVIIIAHRLSTVRGAERIYVVSGGKIAEAGNHGELLEKQGVYAELYANG